MPKLSKSVPSYRKHRATGQAIVTINGRDYYLGPHNTKASKLEYDRVIGEWLASGRSPAFGKPSDEITIAKLLLAYLTYARTYYGADSRGEYANMIHAVRPLKRLYADHMATEFGTTQLKASRQTFVDAGHCRSHVNASTRRIVRVFRWAAGEGILAAEVANSLAMVPGLKRGHTEAPEGRKVKPVASDVVDATLPHLPTIVRAMVELQLATGMRPGELCILRPRDVDRSGDVWEYKPTQHKNQNRELERTVYIGPRGQDVLRPYLLRDAEAYCFSPADGEAKRRAELHEARRTPLKYGNRPGSKVARTKRRVGVRYTPSSYLVAIRRACDKAFPVPEEIAEDSKAVEKWLADHRWSPNRLRHAMATRVRREAGIEAAKTLLGHSQLNTTGIYAEQDRQRAIDVALRIG